MIENSIKTRRSISIFKDIPVEKRLLDEIISISSYAPSSCNTQPWFFLIFETEESKFKLNKFVEEGYRMTSENFNDKKILGVVYKSLLNFFAKYGKFDKAPVYILLFSREYDVPIFSQAMEISKNKGILKIAKDSVMTSSALAMQNFLLLAHEKGLGTRVKDGIKFLMNFEDLKTRFYEEFQIPKEYELVSGIQVGYPEEFELEKKPKKRLPLEKIRRFV